MVVIITHSVVTVALIAAYVAVTLTGHDGNPILGILGGYLAGAGVQKGTDARNGAG